MGPGYFPTVLGALLALVGLLAMVRGSWRPGEPVGRFAHRHIFLILVSTVLFGVLIRGAGLVAAAAVLVMVSAYASRRFRLGPSALLATGMAAFCALLFVKALGLPIPLLGAWLGG
jgi:putative tricarboxylic transport membrane protein